MRIDFLLHPVRAWRARKLRLQLKAEAFTLQGRVEAALETTKGYEAHTKYGRSQVAVRRKQLKDTLSKIKRYLRDGRYGAGDRRPLNRLRGDFTEANVKLTDAIRTDEAWRKQAEDLRAKMRAGQNEADKIDSPELARHLAGYQRNFRDTLHRAETYTEFRDVNSSLVNASGLARSYAFEVKRARRVMDELPGIQTEFEKIEVTQINRDPQGWETYNATLATLKRAQQKIQAGSFNDAEHNLNAVRSNVARLQTLATRTSGMAEEQIKAWSELAREHPAFQREFGEQLEAAASRIPAKRGEAWSQLSQPLLERAMAAAGAAWEEDLPAARDMHPALDMPWPVTISEGHDANVSWEKLIGYADAVATATGMN
ncbi:MAG TPA: hypothetical protein VIB39_17750 [Candidatus Angelobacter sp.]|jgi:hypothetical protein